MGLKVNKHKPANHQRRDLRTIRISSEFRASIRDATLVVKGVDLNFAVRIERKRASVLKNEAGF